MRFKALCLALVVVAVQALSGVSFAGSVLGDTDGDGVDDILDNCRDRQNAPYPAGTAQLDTDGDGCGNLCDGDYDNNGFVGGSDFNRMRLCFGHPASFVTPVGPCAPVDGDGNGIIGSVDFHVIRIFFGKKPGVSLSPLRKPALCRGF